jgi:enoyl-CoA hydratase/carnithine racemase
MEKRKHLKDLQCQHRGNLGVVRMNREHRHNILTPNFTKQIKRGVDTMYHDHNVELIYLTTPKGQHFSNGTDFRTLLHYQANNETDKLVEYLGDIF